MKLNRIIVSLIIFTCSLSASAQIGEKERKALWENYIANIINGNEEAVIASAEDYLDFAAYFDDEVCAMFGKTSAEQITDLVTEEGETLLVAVSDPYTRTYFTEEENPEAGGKNRYVTIVTYRMVGTDFKLVRVQNAFLGGDVDYRKNITTAVGNYEVEATRLSQLRKIIEYMKDGDVKNIKASSLLTDENWIEIGAAMLPDVNFKRIDADESIKRIFELLHEGIETFYTIRKINRMHPRLEYSGRPLSEEELMYEGEGFEGFEGEGNYRVRKEIKTSTKVDGVDHYMRVRLTFSIDSPEKGLALISIYGQPQEPMADREKRRADRETEYAAEMGEMEGAYGEEMMEAPEFRIKENKTDREKVWNSLFKAFEEKEVNASTAHFPLEWNVDFVNADLDGFHYGDDGGDIPFLSAEEFNAQMAKLLDSGVADHLATLSLEELEFGNWPLLSEVIDENCCPGEEHSEEGYSEEGQEYSEEEEEIAPVEEWEEERGAEGAEGGEYSEEGEEGYYDGEGGYSTTPRYAAYLLRGTFLVEKNLGFEQNHYDLTVSLIEGEWKLTSASLTVGWK